MAAARSRARSVSSSRRSLAERLESRTLLSAGDLDPTFGAGGVAFPTFAVPGASRPEAVAIAPGNKAVVAGAARLSVEDPTPVAAVARLNADGSPDATFDGDGWARLNVGEAPTAVSVQPDGKVVAAGSSVGGTLFVARLNADGSPDASFHGDGVFELDRTSSPTGFPNVVGIAMQGDGKIVLAGGVQNFWVARLNADGSLDTPYGFGGFNVIDPTDGTDRPESLALDGAGRVYVGGVGRINMPAGARAVVVRFNAFGRADTTFGGGDGVVT